jgi:hypothetical protein
MTIPTNIGELICAATLAKGAVDRIHDLSSLDSAQRALGYYGRLLLQATPADHELLSQIRDDRDQPLPKLTALHTRYLDHWAVLYTQVHATKPLAA